MRWRQLLRDSWKKADAALQANLAALRSGFALARGIDGVPGLEPGTGTD